MIHARPRFELAYKTIVEISRDRMLDKPPRGIDDLYHRLQVIKQRYGFPNNLHLLKGK